MVRHQLKDVRRRRKPNPIPCPPFSAAPLPLLATYTLPLRTRNTKPLPRWIARNLCPHRIINCQLTSLLRYQHQSDSSSTSPCAFQKYPNPEYDHNWQRRYCLKKSSAVPICPFFEWVECDVELGDMSFKVTCKGKECEYLCHKNKEDENQACVRTYTPNTA